MSIEAEIDATVSAFVADLMDLVQTIALESVREALGGMQPRSPARTHGPPAPARPAPRAPALSPSSTSSRSPRNPPARPPSPAAASGARPSRPPSPPPSTKPVVERGFGGGVRVVPPRAHASRATEAPVSQRPAAPPPPPVVVRVMPPQRRRGTTRKAAPPPPPPVETSPSGQTPAKKWVVVRRPARDKVAPGDEASSAPKLPVNAGGSEPSSPAPEGTPKPPQAPPGPGGMGNVGGLPPS